jgi:hypothetical protein
VEGVKYDKKKTIVIISLCVLVVVLFYWARPHNRFLLTFFPPKNLYVPLVKQNINLSEKVVYPEIHLTHNYVGTYVVRIYIQKLPPYDTPIISNAELNLKISSDNHIFFEKNFTRWTSSFWGGERGTGVNLGFYKIPEKYPLEKTLKL